MQSEAVTTSVVEPESVTHTVAADDLSVNSHDEKAALDAQAQDSPDVSKTEDSPDEAHSTDAPDDSEYPSGFPLVILTIGLCLALFVVALDNTIIGMGLVCQYQLSC